MVSQFLDMSNPEHVAQLRAKQDIKCLLCGSKALSVAEAFPNIAESYPDHPCLDSVICQNYGCESPRIKQR